MFYEVLNSSLDAKFYFKTEVTYLPSSEILKVFDGTVDLRKERVCKIILHNTGKSE